MIFGCLFPLAVSRSSSYALNPANSSKSINNFMRDALEKGVFSAVIRIDCQLLWTCNHARESLLSF